MLEYRTLTARILHEETGNFYCCHTARFYRYRCATSSSDELRTVSRGITRRANGMYESTSQTKRNPRVRTSRRKMFYARLYKIVSVKTGIVISYSHFCVSLSSCKKKTLPSITVVELNDKNDQGGRRVSFCIVHSWLSHRMIICERLTR